MKAFRLLSALFLLLAAAPAWTQTSRDADEAQIREVIDRWYVEMAKTTEGRFDDILAPDAIDATPHIRHIENGSAALGPPIYTHMSGRAEAFLYEIGALRIDASFAKVQVQERGYYYAAAARTPSVRGMRTTFLLEKQPADGRWLVLVHQSIFYPPEPAGDPISE